MTTVTVPALWQVTQTAAPISAWHPGREQAAGGGEGQTLQFQAEIHARARAQEMFQKLPGCQSKRCFLEAPKGFSFFLKKYLLFTHWAARVSVLARRVSHRARGL